MELWSLHGMAQTLLWNRSGLMTKSKIWKFPLEQPVGSGVPWEFHILTPVNTQPLHFGYDGMGVLCMWGQFQTALENAQQTMVFYVVPTGEPFNLPTSEHVATVIQQLEYAMPVVFHIFRGSVYQGGEKNG
jgi:hypothetical protein